MKKLLFICLLSTMLATVSQAQPIVHSGTYSKVNTDSQTSYIYPLKANGDTIIFGQIGFAAVACTGDSLTGGTAGVFTIQGSLTAANDKWYDIGTPLTVNGATQSASAITTINPCIYRRIRGKWVTTGTQTSRGNLIIDYMNSVPN